jgi:CheY-like chemotaxis protein
MMDGVLAQVDAPAQLSQVALLVEDEPLVAIVAEECLRAIGYESVVAHSAQDAAMAMENGFKPAFAVIDVGLPDGRGDALVGRLRSLHADLRVIIVSGYEEDELREQFKGDDAVTIVAKPYTELDLARAVQRLGLELREG